MIYQWQRFSHYQYLHPEGPDRDHPGSQPGQYMFLSLDAQNNVKLPALENILGLLFPQMLKMKYLYLQENNRKPENYKLTKSII